MKCLDIQTKNCILCKKKATQFTGHVTNYDLKISAGWCNECVEMDVPQVKETAGWCGIWTDDMGFEITTID